jgi:hypothetical protein
MAIQVDLNTQKVKLNIEFKRGEVVLDSEEVGGLYDSITLGTDLEGDPVVMVDQEEGEWFAIPLREGTTFVTVTAEGDGQPTISDTIEVEVTDE